MHNCEKTNMKRTYALIMAGGYGERLWPLSTKERPKQFLKLIGERTMLQETVHRIAPLVSLESTYVVVSREHVKLVLEQLPVLPSKNVIIEPMGRGTAPCIGLASLRLQQRDPEGVMFVLPADHVIKDVERFLKLLRAAAMIAQQGTHLMTLGIPPRNPATGYGYIRAEARQVGGPTDVFSAFKVKRFTEKPDLETAERFLREGHYYWNSGMFIWRSDAILREIETHMSALYEGLMQIKLHLGTPHEQDVVEQIYRDQESISIDYGVMEKSPRVLVLPTGDIGWSDVGDWSVLADVLKTDVDGNVIQAQHQGINTYNNVIVQELGKAGIRWVMTLGVSDLVIVDTTDVLLVISKERAQDVKELMRRYAEHAG